MSRPPSDIIRRCGIFALLLVRGGLRRTRAADAARALMGVGGPMMWPGRRHGHYAFLPESKRGLAGGMIIGVAGDRQRPWAS